MSSFLEILQLIKAGQPVDAGVVNAPLTEIFSDVQSLYQFVQAAGIGATVVLPDATVASTVLVGQPVYYNSITQQYEAAIAATVTDTVTGLLTTAPSSDVWGIVQSKTNATLATLLLFGYAPLDLSHAITNPVAAGTYYLSASVPGHLVLAKPPVSVPVLRADGLGNVFVNPSFVDFLDRHVHYHFSLTAAPAGDTSPPGPGGRHSITSPDVTKPGWLPADHESFEGKAPAGAEFGYNLAAQPSLLAVFPPLPVQSAYLEWNRGETETLMGMGVPMGPTRVSVIDRNGIWWMTNCEGMAPWPEDLDTASPVDTSISLDECPYVPEMQIDLWFTRVNFATDAATVTTLVSTDSRLKITCHGTSTPASSGDLQITLNLAFLVSTLTQKGYIVLKNLVDGNSFQAGPVAEGVYALSNNITLTAPATRPLTSSPGAPTLYMGPVGIAVQTLPSLELPVQLVRLQSTNEDYPNDLMVLSFPATYDTSLRGKIEVPGDVGLTNPQLTLRFRILGYSVGTVPALTVTARHVPRPVPASTPIALPLDAAEFTVVIDTSLTLAVANRYYEVSATAFAVTPGDLLFFTVERSSTDGYTGDVGILQMVGVLSAGG